MGVPDSEPPDQAAPDQAAQDQAAPDQAAPDQLVPDQLVPDQQVPDQQVPDQLVPDQLAPDQLVPDQLVPDQLVPDQLVPDQLVPDQMVPDQLVPDQMIPDLPPPPSCTDGKKNGSETGVDCGGTCPPCALGSGGDGALTVAKGKTTKFETLTVAGVVASITGATLGSPDAAKFKAGDEILLINLQGTKADTGAVGNHEFLTIKSVAAGAQTVELFTPPVKAFGNSGGNASLTGQKVFMIRVPHYTSVTIDGTLTASRYVGTTAGLGVVVFRSKSTVSVPAGGSINLTGAGYYSTEYSCNGVSGKPGESLAPQPKNVSGKCWYANPTNQPNFGGGGGGLSNCNTYACATQSIGAGGGGASHATKGSAGKNNGNKQKGGLPGLTYGKADLSRLHLGSGGGAGAGGYSGPGTGHPGGDGGGLIHVVAAKIAVAGSVVADGQVGGDNHCTISHGSGSGGGGSGGTIYLRGKTVTLGTVRASGGKVSCKGGGSGGAGRVRIDYGVLNGKSYPNASASVSTPAAYMGKF